MTTPPSFDQLYHSQGDINMPSQQSSFDQYTASAFASASGAEHQFGPIYAQQLGDEPGSLGVDDSARILNHRSSQEVLRPRYGLGDPRADVERKDSVPFDPISSSTIIASASNTPSKSFMHQQQYHDQYNHGGQFSLTPHHQAMSPQMQDLSPQQSDMMPPPHRPDFSFQNQGFHQEPQVLAGTAQTNEWQSANDFLQQNGGDPESDNHRASWAGSQHLGYDGQQQMDEIQRIISNAPSHAGTPAPGSRVASPFLPPENPNMGHVRHDSTSSIARSPSPFGSMAAPSPPAFQTTSASGSPSFSKPQSPPALIIPNSAPSPSFASVSVVANMNQQSDGSSRFGKSLLPPVNPQLEHLTGMAGISPIAPSADGPMITIQPSTPISPLKAHASIFDNVLRRVSSNFQQLNQQNHQDQQLSDQHQLHQQQLPLSNGMPSPGEGLQSVEHDNSVFDAQWNDGDFGDLAVPGQMRPRSKSDSYMADGGAFDRQAATQLMGGPMAQFFPQQQQQHPQQQQQQGINMGSGNQWGDINAWRVDQARETHMMTLDPRNLTSREATHIQSQLHHMEAQQRAHQLQINTCDVGSSGVFKYEPDQVSPTSAAFYVSMGLQAPSTNIIRRRSFNDGLHPAAGAGTPGYGVQFSMPGAITPPGRVRGGSFNLGHRRKVQSEDFSRGGWGIGQEGASTAAFIQAMANSNDGMLLPPTNRGRSMSHSRHSSASSVRSPSPALSISSQGSSYSHHSRMAMPDGVQPEQFIAAPGDAQVEGCGSTFTRAFNLKGHMRSHKDERPYKCTYPNCNKAIVGFARQHDCKRHMLLHEKQRPFKYRSEQGQQCAITHPLPTNPDGSAMTESQYKARLRQLGERNGASAGDSSRGGRSSIGLSGDGSADERDLMNGLEADE
ncbi:hypothetical protein CspeluHIS016_0108960 [Cutaneotrichosporon spelunceum]|uniref:C2H2-type domain-containing protein n=1 Tax=Cutaneotrichosporon spelunceum TaxID=1672016 RepID=A0AAD3TQ36_9TREE|nr:hypothetical protein CspeluHIS016_0108960 [Cutaneotrichosporon spelunceum]